MKKPEKQQNLNNLKNDYEKQKKCFTERQISEEALKLSLRRTVKNQPVPNDLEAKVFNLIEQIK